MKRSYLIAALVGFVAIVSLANHASAMYDPGTGRFLQRDPGPGGSMRAGVSEPAMGGSFMPMDPTGQYGDGVNLYQYVQSSPITRVDPQGLFAIKLDYGKFDVTVTGPGANGPSSSDVGVMFIPEKTKFGGGCCSEVRFVQAYFYSDTGASWWTNFRNGLTKNAWTLDSGLYYPIGGSQGGKIGNPLTGGATDMVDVPGWKTGDPFPGTDAFTAETCAVCSKGGRPPFDMMRGHEIYGCITWGHTHTYNAAKTAVVSGMVWANTDWKTFTVPGPTVTAHWKGQGFAPSAAMSAILKANGYD